MNWENGFARAKRHLDAEVETCDLSKLTVHHEETVYRCVRKSVIDVSSASRVNNLSVCAIS